ncbi:MAG: putative signal peptide protein [Herbaspirillum sp.]|nr:putative signal peptide protein [Herbaspirillum sp.]
MKRMLCTAALIAAAGSILMPLSAVAQVGVSVVIGNQPPPPRYEPVPAPRAGYIWAPGYWNWDGRGHVWAPGHWEQADPYRQYRPAQWRQGPHGWVLDRGGWDDRGDRHRDDHHDEHHDDHHR